MVSGVFDTSAVLAILQDEPGRAVAEKMLGGAAISTVNLAELAAKLSDANFPDSKTMEYIDGMSLSVVAFDMEYALVTGALRAATRKFGLSLGDRACLATARMLGVPAVTADRSWAALDLGIDIRIIR
ncbi:PIN domain-containing protein [soil metagenome]